MTHLLLLSHNDSCLSYPISVTSSIQLATCSEQQQSITGATCESHEPLFCGAAPRYQSGAMHAAAFPASGSTGSSLDAAWGAPPSQSSVPARAPASNQYMAPSHQMPHLAEPGSPSLSIARNQRSHHANKLCPLCSIFQPARPPLHSTVPCRHLRKASQPLQRSSCRSPAHRSSYCGTAERQAQIETGQAQVEEQVEASSRRKLSRIKCYISHAAPAPVEVRQAVFPISDGVLPHFASPSQIFARAPAMQVEPPSEEPQTPPPPVRQTLTVQESPDPLNLLSPNGHFSLWQQPSSAPHPPPPFPTNGPTPHPPLAPPPYDANMREHQLRQAHRGSRI